MSFTAVPTAKVDIDSGVTFKPMTAPALTFFAASVNAFVKLDIIASVDFS